MISLQIRADLVSAMKAHDELTVSVLRMVVSAFKYKEVDLMRELTEADELLVLQNEAKKRREAIASYESGGRAEQAAQEKAELLILQKYLPKMLSEEELKAELAKLEMPKDF